MLRGQKILSDPLGLQVQLILSCPAWGLGTELESSTRPASTPNRSAISPTLRINVAGFKCVAQYRRVLLHCGFNCHHWPSPGCSQHPD